MTWHNTNINDISFIQHFFSWNGLFFEIFLSHCKFIVRLLFYQFYSRKLVQTNDLMCHCLSIHILHTNIYNCSLIFNRYVDVCISFFTRIQLILRRFAYTRLQSIKCLCSCVVTLCFQTTIFVYTCVCIYINNLCWYSKHTYKHPLKHYCYPFWAFVAFIKVEYVKKVTNKFHHYKYVCLMTYIMQ